MREGHESLWIKLLSILAVFPSSAECNCNRSNFFGGVNTCMVTAKFSCRQQQWDVISKLKFVYIMVGRVQCLRRGKDLDISQRTDCNVTALLFNVLKLGKYNNLPTSGVGLQKSSTKSITSVLTNMGRRHFSGPLLSTHCYRLRPRLQKSHRRSPLSWFSCWNFTFNCQVSSFNFKFQVAI